MISKKHLDTLMKEYDWDKNEIEDTLEFLSFMFVQYDRIKEKE